MAPSFKIHSFTHSSIHPIQCDGDRAKSSPNRANHDKKRFDYLHCF